MGTLLYHVTFAAYQPHRNMLHLFNCERFIACVKAIEDNRPLRAYHLYNGKHWTPDYAAIRIALPHYHRPAFDRAKGFWFPLTLASDISEDMNIRNGASMTLYDRKNRLLGTIYAIPYMKESIDA